MKLQVSQPNTKGNSTMNTPSPYPLFAGSLVALATLGVVAQASADTPQHHALHTVMEGIAANKPTTIVFFGGSITWGATATDPLRTSWRALVEQTLRERHPHTPLRFVDAAIGGQPSQLGVFRMDRDVLPFEPDLVFIEFTVNDGARRGADEWMEGIVRKLMTQQPQAAIVPVVLGYANAGGQYVSPGRDTHLQVFAHYGLPVIDAVPVVQERIAEGLVSTDFLTDGVHPNDAGYRLYADIIMAQLDALSAQRGPPAPVPAEPVTANSYETARLIELTTLDHGDAWEAGVPSVVGTWFDHQPSRWHTSTLRPTRPGAQVVHDLDLTGAGLYFELVPDGKPLTLRIGDTEHLTVQTANNLIYARVNYTYKPIPEAGRHTLILEAPEGGPAAVAYLLVTGPGN